MTTSAPVALTIAATAPDALVRFGGACAPVLLDAALKGTAVLLAAAVALRAMRRAPAAGRHWVCALALGSLLVLPAVSATLPGWGVLPRWADVSATAAAGARSEAAPPAPPPLVPPPPAPSPDGFSRDLGPAADEPWAGGDRLPSAGAPFPFDPSRVPSRNVADVRPIDGEPSAERASGARSPVIAADGVRRSPDDPAVVPLSPRPEFATTNAGRPAETASTIWHWVGLAWLVGAAGVLLPAVAGAVSLAWLSRTTNAESDARVLATAGRLAAELDIRRRVRLLRRPGAMPMTWGVFRPRVLLPTEAADWSAGRLRAVLLHELGHVRRSDCLAAWVGRLAVAVYWFHPLAWVVAARLRREQEAACDELVLRHGEPASDYAGHLLYVATTAANATRGGGLAFRAAAPMARAGGVEARVRAILDDRAGRRSLTRAAAALLAVAAVAVVLPLAMARGAADGRAAAGTAATPPSPAAPATSPAVAPAAAAGPATTPSTRPATAPAAAVAPGRSKHALSVTGAAGRPVAGAHVWLVQDYPSFPMCPPDQPTVNGTADTGADGRAEVDWPVGVRTNLIVRAAGLAPAYVPGAELAADRPYDVRLAAGQPITGTVRRLNGVPIAGARVTAVRQRFLLDYLPEFAPTATTDGEGAFSMPATAAGNYLVTAEVEGGEPVYAESTPVEVPVERPPEPLELVARPGAAIKGRFATAYGVQVAGRTVTLLLRERDRHVTRYLKAGPDGTFTVGGIPPGAIGDLLFDDAGEYLAAAEWPQPPVGASARLGQAKFAGLGVGVYDGLTVRLVKAARFEAVVVDEKGEPYQEAAVTVEPWQRMFSTDKAGKVTGRMPPDLDVTWAFSGAPYYEFNPKVGPVRAGEGETVTRRVVIRRQPEVPTDRELAGQVVDAAGAPVPGAEVYLGNHGVLPRSLTLGATIRGKDGPTWSEGLFRPAAVRAGPDGRFRFNRLQPGRTDVWATVEGVRWGWARDVETSQKDVRVALAPMPERPTFEGTVVDPAGRPAAGATVYLVSGDPTTGKVFGQTGTDAAGRFVIGVGGVPRDHNRHANLIARASPAVPDGVGVARPDAAVTWRTVPRCGGAGVRLAFKPDAAVSGRLVDRRGQPLAGAEVRLYLGRDPDVGDMMFARWLADLSPRTTTGPDGRFSLHGLPRGGEVSVRAKHPDYAEAMAWYVRDVGADTPSGDVEADDGVSLGGVVTVGRGGPPAAGATVALQGVGETLAVTRAGAAGRYEFRGLEPSWMTGGRPRLVATFNGPPATAPAATAPADGGGDEADRSRTGPAWEGATVYRNSLRPGDRDAGVDIVLERSSAARRAAWLARKAAPIPTPYRVAVVEDADPLIEGKPAYLDTLTLLDGDGTVVWRRGDLAFANYGGTIPAAVDPASGAIYVYEAVVRRLTRVDAAGQVSWRRPDGPELHALTFDPAGGTLWGLTEPRREGGKPLVAYDRDGNRTGGGSADGSALAVSPRDGGLWVAGAQLARVDRNGATLWKVSPSAVPRYYGPRAPAVAVNPADGSAWVAEVGLPDLAVAQNLLHVVEPDGRVRLQLDLGEWVPGPVAVDAPRGVVWLAGSRGSGPALRKLDLATGRVLAEFPVGGDLCVEPDTGCVWVAAREGVYRLSPTGEPIWAKPSAGMTAKVVRLVPPPAAK